MGEMTKVKFTRELDSLIAIRDELMLKAHLAKAEVKDELDRLEAKWQLIEGDLRLTASHAKEPLHAIGEKTAELINELKQGYESIRGRLS